MYSSRQDSRLVINDKDLVLNERKITFNLPIAVLFNPSPLYKNWATSCGSCFSRWFSYRYSMPVKLLKKKLSFTFVSLKQQLGDKLGKRSA
jgi:hypothetical protein